MEYTSGKELKRYRLELKLTLRKMAKVLGVTTARLRRIERAVRVAVQGLAQRYEDCLHLRDARVWGAVWVAALG